MTTIDVLLVLIGLVTLLALVLHRRVSAVADRLAGLSRLEAKIDLLLKHAGLAYDPYKNVPAAVADAVQRGQKIEAIKLYRTATGVGLKEAKDCVEEIARRAGRGGVS